MDDHKKDADVILDEEWQQQLPGNALYFIGVLVVCFVIVSHYDQAVEVSPPPSELVTEGGALGP
jgi:hypothetical protein